MFLWSYRNTVLNQSVCVFALGYFLKYINQINSDVFGSPDKLREVVLKFNEQNALDEMILAPAT